MNHKSRPYRALALAWTLGALAMLASQCSETTSPSPPTAISIQSGNLQYWRRGSALPAPLVVKVTTDQGDAPDEAHVVFTVLQGGGILSSTAVAADGGGVASTRYTLGTEVGTNVIQASIKENPSAYVVFEETSANFYCPEQEDTLRVAYGSPHLFFLATRKSNLYTAVNSAGVVELDATIPTLSATPFAEIPGTVAFDTNIYDAAFSARGDYYVARRAFQSEILKVDWYGEVSFFAKLDENLPPTDMYVEIETNPTGLLAGCDANGPFIIGCPDTLIRFPQATFVNASINNDAFAVDQRRQSEDPLGEDIYFIDEPNSNLMRLALDSLTVEARGVEIVAGLPKDAAVYARGMVCDPTGGNVYILVDGDLTKQILEVTPSGSVSVVYDFFDRGDGDAAGMQRDLAFDISNGRRYLFTIDTLNDNILRFDLGSRTLAPMFSDSLMQAAVSNRGAEGQLIGGERVGLTVLR